MKKRKGRVKTNWNSVGTFHKAKGLLCTTTDLCWRSAPGCRELQSGGCLHGTGPRSEYLRWKAADIDFVESKFVFMWNVEMTSQNRRSWSVANYDKLLVLHRKFQEDYC